MAFTYAPFVPGVVETQTPETENPTLLSPRWFHNKFTAFVTSSDHSAPRLRLPATLENWRSQKYSAEGALLPRCVSASTMYGTGLEEDADLAGGAGGAGARFEYEYAAPPPGQVRNDESASTRWRIYQVLASGVSGVGRWVVGTEHEKEAVNIVATDLNLNARMPEVVTLEEHRSNPRILHAPQGLIVPKIVPAVLPMMWRPRGVGNYNPHGDREYAGFSFLRVMHSFPHSRYSFLNHLLNKWLGCRPFLMVPQWTWLFIQKDSGAVLNKYATTICTAHVNLGSMWNTAGEFTSLHGMIFNLAFVAACGMIYHLLGAVFAVIVFMLWIFLVFAEGTVALDVVPAARLLSYLQVNGQKLLKQRVTAADFVVAAAFGCLHPTLSAKEVMNLLYQMESDGLDENVGGALFTLICPEYSNSSAMRKFRARSPDKRMAGGEDGVFSPEKDGDFSSAGLLSNLNVTPVPRREKNI